MVVLDPALDRIKIGDLLNRAKDAAYVGSLRGSVKLDIEYLSVTSFRDGTLSWMV